MHIQCSTYIFQNIINKVQNFKELVHIMKAFKLVILLLLAVVAMSNDEEQQQMMAFAQHLADFTPQQSFEFQLQPGEQQTFIFWPLPTQTSLKGLFYITSEENRGLFVGCETDSEIHKSFYDKKIGVFNVPYKGLGDMKLILKSEIHTLKIYISYEFEGSKKQVKVERRPTQQEDGQKIVFEQKVNADEKGEQNPLGKILQKFKKVELSISSQQQVLKAILKGSVLQVNKIEQQINQKTMKAIIETLIVVASGCISVWMLKKQLKNGYELIV